MENLVMNYLILWITARFSKAKTTSLRLLLGALAGAVYVSVMILFPAVEFYYSIPAKLMLSVLILLIAFRIDGFGTFAKTLAILYISTFVFAGAAFAFLYLNSTGGFVRNGIVYIFWKSKWSTLALSILTAAIILKVFWELVQYKLSKGRLLKTVGISVDKRKVSLQALVDTGNSLHDPITKLPVVVVEFAAISSILPEEIKEIFTGEGEEDLSRLTALVSGSSWYSRFRLIPFTSLGKENGMLIGFKPDYLEIDSESDEKKGIYNVIVGIYNKALSKNNSYRALVGPDLL